LLERVNNAVRRKGEGERATQREVGVSYDYDARGQLTTVSDPRAGRWHFQYDALGRLLQRTHSSGERRSLAYTPEGFVEKIEVNYPAGGADVFSYADHDILGNPQTLTTRTARRESETVRRRSRS
jgi:YD repeat-containing protein